MGGQLIAPHFDERGCSPPRSRSSVACAGSGDRMSADRLGARWSGSRCTCSCARARRSSALAPRDSASRRTPTPARSASRSPAPCRCLNAQAVTLAVRAALALGCDGAHHVGLRAQELLLSRPAQGLPDLAVRSAAGHARRRHAGGWTRTGAARASASRACTWRRTPGSRCTTGSRASPPSTSIASGVPLIEIVSEPDLRSAAEARRVPAALKQVLEYIGRQRREHGGREPARGRQHQRAPRRATPRSARKTEIKNMNSFSGVERALEAEFARQCGILDARRHVVQQTMLWDGGRAARAPGAREGRQPRLPVLSRARPPTAAPADAWIDDQRRALPELPGGAGAPASARALGAPGDGRRRAHSDRARWPTTSSGRRGCRGDAEDRRELGDGRGARGAQATRGTRIGRLPRAPGGPRGACSTWSATAP